MNPASKLIRTLGILLVLCLGFGWWQNAHGSIGGDISVAKVLWIWLTLSCFFVIPAALRSHATSRQMWTWFLGGFVLRAVIELPMLLFTRAWRCEHGIAHDIVMLAVLVFFARKLPVTDRVSRWFAPVLALALGCEMLNAWLFGNTARPQDGIYFASGDAAFAMINRITWTEIALLVPMLMSWLMFYRRQSR